MDPRDHRDRADAALDSPRAEPLIASHWRPRTRAGRVAVLLFLALMALAQPPFVHGPANRIAPWLLGLPFLYVYLLVLYTMMIGVLIWVYRRGL